MSKHCTECGHIVGKKANYCGQCGHPVREKCTKCKQTLEENNE